MNSQSVSLYHGHISGPKSRALIVQEAGNIDTGVLNQCESGKFFPAVEGGGLDPVAPSDVPGAAPPRDGEIASGGHKQGRYLDEAGTHWPKHSVKSGQTVPVEWNYTAPHLTRRWNYFITKPGWDPNQKLSRESFEKQPFYKVELTAQPYWPDNPALVPPIPTKHNVTLPERAGYHVLLGIWEVANTGNAFYQVIDLDFEGTETDQRPIAPSGVHARNISKHSVELYWTAASGGNVASYKVYRNGVAIQSVSGQQYHVTDGALAAGNTYTYYVTAVNSQGEESTPSQSVDVKTLSDEAENGPPSAPSNLHTMDITTRSISLMWSGSSAGGTVEKYHVYRDGRHVGTTSVRETAFTDTDLEQDNWYSYYVTAHSASGLVSTSSNVIDVKTDKEQNTPEPENYPEWKLAVANKPGDIVVRHGDLYIAVNKTIANVRNNDPQYWRSNHLWKPYNP